MATTIKIKSKWKPPTPKREKNTGEVHTKPNQSQSIREILFRNTQGMAYDNYKTPYYEDQATFTSKPLNIIQDMEPSEKLQYLKEVRLEAQSLANKIKDFEKQKEILAQETLEQQQQSNADTASDAQQSDASSV